MPVYLDTNNQTYFCDFRYKNYIGQTKGTTKRGFKTYHEAKKWEDKFKSENQGYGNLTFNQFSIIYLNDLKNRVSENTFKNREYYITARLIPFFGNMKIKQIKPLHIREWQNEVLKDNLSLTYMKNLNGTLNQMMKLALLMFGLSYNPCIYIKPIGKNISERCPVISPEQFRLLISYTQNELTKLAFQVLYFTGIRLGELLALTPKDFNYTSKSITINKSLTVVQGVTTIKKPKTPNSIRTITIPQSLNILLSEYVKNISLDDIIFQISKTSLHRELKYCCDKINHTKMRIHDFRHSHASFLIQTGTNLMEVSHRLGHKNLYTTLKTYAHYIPELDNSIPDRLEFLWESITLQDNNTILSITPEDSTFTNTYYLQIEPSHCN